MEGVFVLTDGTTVGRMPITTVGNLVGVPRVGEVVYFNEDPPRKVVSLRWYFDDEYNCRVEIVLDDEAASSGNSTWSAPDGAAAVVNAWKNPGPRPDLHEVAKRDLTRRWPTLALAIKRLVNESDEK